MQYEEVLIFLLKWYHSYCSGYIVSRVIFWYNKNHYFQPPSKQRRKQHE